MRDARARPRAGFQFNVQKWPVVESGHASLLKKAHLDPKSGGHPGGRKVTGGALTSTNDL